VVIVPDMLHWGERGLFFEADPPRIRQRTSDVTKQDVMELRRMVSSYSLPSPWKVSNVVSAAFWWTESV
jgi:hypothetical protein